jgi:nitrite reductase/ring-hydroxylating ferredoxin subunit
MSEKTDRRHFLKVVGGGLGAAALTQIGCSDGGSKADAGGTPLNAKSIAVGQIVAYPSGAALVARDAQGLYAMSSMCTHASCDLRTTGEFTAAGVQCSSKKSCGHDSLFDLNGKAVSGPATSTSSPDLAHFELTVATDGAITVNVGKQVPASTRTPG